MRIIFFGSDRWFSPPVLEALLSAGHDVPVVITKGTEVVKSILKNKLSGRVSYNLISEEEKRANLTASLKILKYRIRDRVSKTLISQKIQEVEVVEAKTGEDISKKRMVEMVRMAETAKMAKTVKTAGMAKPFDNFNHFNHSSHLSTPDAIVLASFGPPFLPIEVLNWPKYGCLNVHASLLPRWRGAAPVFAALAAGDKETGVSIMKMTAEIDRGTVLGQKKLSIRQPVQKSQLKSAKISLDQIADKSDQSDSDSADLSTIRLGPPAAGQADPAETPTFQDYDDRETLTKRLGKLGGELIVDTLKKLETGQIIETPQPKKSPTLYTRRLTKESGRIDWSQSPIQIERFIRAATPWPGAWTEYRAKGQRLKAKGQTLKILKVHLTSLSSLGPWPLALGPNLVIDEVQLPGKNPVSWKQFLAGHPGAELG